MTYYTTCLVHYGASDHLVSGGLIAEDNNHTSTTSTTTTTTTTTSTTTTTTTTKHNDNNNDNNNIAPGCRCSGADRDGARLRVTEVASGME